MHCIQVKGGNIIKLEYVLPKRFITIYTILGNS
jgi:hypothetical protein